MVGGRAESQRGGMTSTRAAAAALVTCSLALAVMGAAPAYPSPGSGGASPPVSSGGPWPSGTVKSVGKLVAKLPNNQAESCSAAIVDSPNGSVVATAAHCIASPERPQAPEAMYFQPGYDSGGGPAAVLAKGWKVQSWKTAPGWNVHKDLESILPNDWAFLKMGRRGGKTIEQVYGASTLHTGPVGAGRTVTLGYPVTSPYDGETLNYCAGQARPYRRGEIGAANVGALALRPCTLTQGVSGGPWLRNVDVKRGTGTLVAVTSVGSANELLGRPYPAAARAVFRRIGATAGSGHPG